MQRKTFLKTAVVLTCGSSTHSRAQVAARMRIGLTPVILADQAAFLSRWSRYLSQRMECEVSFAARESYQGVLDLLFAGQLDAAWICGYPYVRHQTQLQLISVPLYLGKPLYQAYLIRSRRSLLDIRNWADLKGKVLAYSDPLSNSGWLVAQTQLVESGLSPRDLKRSFFAHGHRNVAEAVAARLAHAGSIDGYVWETMRQQGMAAVEQTEVVWKSELFGFPPLVARQGANHPKTGILQSTLQSMQSDQEGQALLAALNLTGFEAGKPAQFDSIRQMAMAAASRVV